jgi:polyhydroxyalkanoate synthase
MFKDSPEFNQLFNHLAASNKSWLENLLALSNDKDSLNGNPALELLQQFFANSKTYLDSNAQFYQQQLNLWANLCQHQSTKIATEKKKVIDRRFSDPDWENNPFFAYLKQSYFSLAQQLFDFIKQADMDTESKFRMEFFMRQYIDAISPSNFALTNPEVIKAMIETKGKSLAEGMRNMMEDVQQGYISMTDETQFEVGKNLATTPGAVIFRNELMELIQYSPTTAKVYQTPLLIVPPCINKYYILDLQENNSMVRYLVDQGFTVFLISWKSADHSIKSFRFEEYTNLGVIAALDAIRQISATEKINTLGYCVGGVILTTAAILLKQRNLEWINTMGQMTTMLDHSNPGDIKAFLDRDLLKLRAAKKENGGVMSGRIIAQTFSALRANELIWNYWVNNYLLGKTPQKFDLLYWNNDTVDLPVPMHAFLMENLYLDNLLVTGNLKIANVTLDLSIIDCPIYLFAAQKDHIVPWKSAYQSTQYLKSREIRFVLGASGHTAGVINPVSNNKRNYWINDKITLDPEEWLAQAQEVPGSWWKDLAQWYSNHSGKQIKAPKIGSKDFPILCKAPGEFVCIKALSLIAAETA